MKAGEHQRMRLYICGNGNLSFSDFLKLYHPPLAALSFDEHEHFIVCDFRGVDTLVMEFLKTRTPHVSVFHVGKRPRYTPDAYKTKVSQWERVGGFMTDAARDRAAIEQCTHFLAFDFNTDEHRTSGTQRNIARCLELGRVRLDPRRRPDRRA